MATNLADARQNHVAADDYVTLLSELNQQFGAERQAHKRLVAIARKLERGARPAA